jgi:hypothetical protein
LKTYTVIATELNLRKAPKIASNNVIARLPQFQVLTALAEPVNGWLNISTVIDGAAAEGFFAFRPAFLAEGVKQASTSQLEVHMANNANAKRSQASARAYPLSEASLPKRDGHTSALRLQQVNAVIDWLAVDQSVRYRKEGSTTFCNIYAYDYCQRVGVYLPRVWWTDNALAKVLQGVATPVEYGNTVTEQRANQIYAWLKAHGATFGWRRTFSFDEAQQIANTGGVAMIIAQRKQLERPGHVAMIVPETPGAVAARDTAGQVSRPVTSQAGRENFRRKAPKAWWTGAQFREFALWLHD